MNIYNPQAENVFYLFLDSQGVCQGYTGEIAKYLDLNHTNIMGSPVSQLLGEMFNFETFEQFLATVRAVPSTLTLSNTPFSVAVSELENNDTDKAYLLSFVSEGFQGLPQRDWYLEKELSQITLDAIHDAVISTDIHERITYMNPAAERLTGWRAEEVYGTHVFEHIHCYNDLTDNRLFDPVHQCRLTNETVSINEHAQLKTRDDERLAIEIYCSPIKNKNDEMAGVVMVIHDIDKTYHYENLIRWQSRHDELTGMLNRKAFEDEVYKVLQEADDSFPNVLVQVDIDKLRLINEACGSDAGDMLIRQVGGAIKGCARNADHVARLGSDEFGMLLCNCSVDNAQKVVGKLRDLIVDKGFHWLDDSYEVRINIGMVGIEKGMNLASAMGAADMACYIAKETGLNRIHIYRTESNQLQQRQNEMQWITRISRALDEDRLLLYKQPIIASDRHNKQQHFEILVRMQSENRQEIIPPGDFIPAAERYNLMPSIDRWVIRHALEYMAKMNDEENQAIKLAINLSAKTIGSDGLSEYIQSLISRLKINAGDLCFEVTETAAIDNFEIARALMDELHAIGCLFALDDFGSGQSSFGYLKNLPVDYLKIDGMFVKDMIDEPIHLAMVEAIHRVGHVMGIQTIAEYVEDEAIWNKLNEIGVDYVQGFGVASPSPLLS